MEGPAIPRAGEAPGQGVAWDRERDMTILSTAHGRLSVRVRVLERILHMFSRVERLEDNFEALLDAVLDAIPAEAASILLADPDAGELVFVAARGPVAQRILGLRMKLADGLAGECVRQGRALAVSDVQRDARYARAISDSLGFETRSLIAVPLLHAGEIFGAIEIVNRRGGDVFPRSELEFLDRIGRAGGSLVHLSRLLQSSPPPPDPAP